MTPSSTSFHRSALLASALCLAIGVGVALPITVHAKTSCSDLEAELLTPADLDATIQTTQAQIGYSDDLREAFVDIYTYALDVDAAKAESFADEVLAAQEWDELDAATAAAFSSNLADVSDECRKSPISIIAEYMAGCAVLGTFGHFGCYPFWEE